MGFNASEWPGQSGSLQLPQLLEQAVSLLLQLGDFTALLTHLLWEKHTYTFITTFSEYSECLGAMLHTFHSMCFYTVPQNTVPYGKNIYGIWELL